MKMNATTWTIIGIVAIAGILIFSSRMSGSASAPKAADGAPLTLAAADHQRGAADGKIVLIEYLDLECEACGAFFPIVKQMEAEFGDRVTFVTRYFPLQGHKNGLTAALAVEAASKQGKFWEMHDLLFARQSEWGGKQVPTPQAFEAYATELGLDIEQFKKDAASSEVMARVKGDYNGGIDAGVRSTPSFFLNGYLIENPRSAEEFRAVLQAEIDKSAPAS